MASSVDAKSMEDQEYIQKNEILEKSSFILFDGFDDHSDLMRNYEVSGLSLVKSVDHKVLQCYPDNAFL